MLIDHSLTEWKHKGHVYGECMSQSDSDLMYVYIPKNASSWTKPNLKDWGWEFYNYRADNLNKHALVILRDPVERWLSGIAEYFTLYYPEFTIPFYETQRLIFDRIVFDDHTEKQSKFLVGLDTDNCTFMRCDTDYRHNFSTFIRDRLGDNKYYDYKYQHTSEESPQRKRLKIIFQQLLDKNPKYIEQIRDYYEDDYKLINSVKFYGA
jgi:hypothetical protein